MEKYLPEINKTPVIKKVKTGLPPEEIFMHFASHENASLLNSSLKTDAGRYSFMGIHPLIVLKGKHHNMNIQFNGHTLKIKDDPFNCLSSILDTYAIENPTPFPISAGGIGYLSYDLKDVLERMEHRSRDDMHIPDIYFVFYRTLLIHDRKDPGYVYISTLDMKSPGYMNADDLIKETEKTVTSQFDARIFDHNKDHGSQMTSNFSRSKYIRAVKKVKDYIRAGDIYQVCLSQRFQTKWHYHPYSLYLKLNRINPAPFSAYLNLHGMKIISSSPERFLKFEDGRIETRPMKGTRKRGNTAGKDKVFKEQLMKSRKDEAELSMIVDLERNDLGKISLPGSVKVTEHRRLETYPTVFQTISIVESRVDNNIKISDIIRSAFPGGSISGCPKIRAMEIIDELELTRRTIYTGSIGYISFHNTMDLNIAIRTMIMKGKDVYFQAGGGIVADSDPESEYEETLVKARALIEALNE